jgi:NAD-dependent dihydropyrimidine dehydrogenase PreA subunit
MAYVITDICEKDGACVDACPVDCIHPHKGTDEEANVTQLYINPIECIDCGACIPVCPFANGEKASGAIYPEGDLPDDKLRFIEINAKYFGQ